MSLIEARILQYGRMRTKAEKWRDTVDPHFRYVRDLGFDKVEVDDRSFWSLWVQYRSRTGAIRVSRSNEFRRAEVELIRLVDGQVPTYPIWITDARIDRTLLDNVIEVRRPDLLVQLTKLTGLGDRDIERQLEFWSQTLRDVAQDFLAGDFSALDAAGDLVRSRVTENPQQVQVWIPEDAPEGAEARQIEEVSATVPPEVGVVVRRYRKGPSQEL